MDARTAPGEATAYLLTITAQSAPKPATVRFDSGDARLRPAAAAVLAADVGVVLLQGDSVTLVRRGMVYCPAMGTHCQFVLLPLPNVP